MKIIGIAIGAYLLCACCVQPKHPTVEVHGSSINQDSICIEELTRDNIYLKDSVLFFHKQNDSLRTQLFLVNYKVEKVKFYLNLCTKNSSQDKFLKGWIRRAVE